MLIKMLEGIWDSVRLYSLALANQISKLLLCRNVQMNQVDDLPEQRDVVTQPKQPQNLGKRRTSQRSSLMYYNEQHRVISSQTYEETLAVTPPGSSSIMGQGELSQIPPDDITSQSNQDSDNRVLLEHSPVVTQPGDSAHLAERRTSQRSSLGSCRPHWSISTQRDDGSCYSDVLEQSLVVTQPGSSSIIGQGEPSPSQHGLGLSYVLVSQPSGLLSAGEGSSCCIQTL